MSDLLPGATRSQLAVEGVRLVLHRADPPRRRRTTPVLLLHGVPETAACWRALLPELARDRIVLAPDLKGLGGSEMVGPYDPATLVRELAALVLHEVDGPVDVVGHDWGGSLGIGLAAERPDLVRRLVVVSAPYRKLDPVRAWHVPFFALPVLPELAFRLGGRRVVPAMFRAAWRGSQRLDPALLAHYTDAYADPARVTAMLGYYRAVTRPKVRSLLTAPLRLAGDGRLPGVRQVPGLRRPSGEPRVGTGHLDGLGRRRGLGVDGQLVVWGAADPVLPLAVAESVVRDLGAGTDMITLPGIGHWPIEEAPEISVPAIVDFLRKRVAAPG